METKLAYGLYTAAFELLRQPAPSENLLRETCAAASVDAALTRAVEQAALDVALRLPRRSERHFIGVVATSRLRAASDHEPKAATRRD